MDKKISKVLVDRNLCIGAASCVVVLGTVFELDGENKAVIKLKGGKKESGPVERSHLEDAAATDDAILIAAQSCPTFAITLLAEDGSKIFPQ